MSMKKLILSFALIIVYGAAAQIHIRHDHAFHGFVLGPQFGVLEDVASVDEGGVLYLFVENHAAVEDSIVNITLKDSADNVYAPYGWYAWPSTMNAANNNFTGITIKGDTLPLRPGSYVKVIVETDNGEKDSIEVNGLKTPALRIGNLVPSQDLTSLYVYLRNEGDSDIQIDSLYYNTEGFEDTDTEITFSGTGTIAPGEMEIIAFNNGDLFEEVSLAAIRIKYIDLGSSDEVFTSAATRIVKPWFSIGTWHSSGFDWANEYGRKRMRRMGIEMLQGPGNYSLMYDGYSRYHMKTIREPGFGDPFDPALAIAEMTPYIDSSFIHTWSVDDEPDLNGKDIDQQLVKSWTYMTNDPNTPVHITLAMQTKYQQYGFYSDIVTMDHYSAPSAPNIIPLTWVPFVGRDGELEEAIEYTEYLKLNTEPRRNWTWVQFAAGIWDTQPEPISVNYQYWGHIAEGAKGIKYFTSTSETKDDFPEIWDEGIRSFKEMKQMRSIALYGEPMKSVSSSNVDAKAKALVGPESMAVIVVNNSIDFTGDVLSSFETIWDELDYSVEVMVPDWISPDDVYMVTEVGKSYDLTVETLGPNSIRITPDSSLAERSHVFYIGPSDNTNPLDLEGLLVAQYIDSANYTLSWKETFDNVGVQGYNVYFEDSLVESVHGLVYEVVDRSINCSGWWKVEPYDNSGNLGGADSLFFVLSGPALDIITQPTDETVFIGGTTLLTVEPNSVVNYQWQYNNGVGWVNFVESLNVIGTNSPNLELNNLTADVTVRCVMNTPCGETITSDEATITVINDLGIASEEIAVEMYPNPADNFVVFRSSSDQFSIEIYDNAGRLVLKEQSNDGQKEVSVLGFESGFYLVKVSNENGFAIKKLIVQ